LTPLVFFFSLFLIFQEPQTWPQSNSFTDSPQIRDEWRCAYEKFKPELRVLAEFEKLKARERDVLNLWSDSECTLRDLNRKNELITIHRHLLLCMPLVAGECDQVPGLIVLLTGTREIMKVFPSGRLPADPLQPNTVYAT
jgi:hypothetical protein